MEKFVNLTPHDITIVGEKATVVIPASGKLCRVTCTVQDTGMTVLGIPVTRNTYGEVEGLPDEEPGVFYIVSSIVRSALIEEGIQRGDVLIPNESVRDENGRIIGCRSLAI